MSEEQRLGREQWKGLIAEQAGSGQTIVGFCRERELSVHQFHYYKARVREEGAGGGFREVRERGRGAIRLVRAGGGRPRIRRGGAQAAAPGTGMSLAISSAQRIFVYRAPCDMRRSFDRLAAMVEHELGQNPMRGDVFLFANRRRTMLKLLYWDGDGFAIWFKRLERGRFRVSSAEELDRAELGLLLEGVVAEKLQRLPRYRKCVKGVAQS